MAVAIVDATATGFGSVAVVDPMATGFGLVAFTGFGFATAEAFSIAAAESFRLAAGARRQGPSSSLESTTGMTGFGFAGGAFFIFFFG